MIVQQKRNSNFYLAATVYGPTGGLYDTLGFQKTIHIQYSPYLPPGPNDSINKYKYIHNYIYMCPQSPVCKLHCTWQLYMYMYNVYTPYIQDLQANILSLPPSLPPSFPPSLSFSRHHLISWPAQHAPFSTGRHTV